jgi:hypothetical protein
MVYLGPGDIPGVAGYRPEMMTRERFLEHFSSTVLVCGIQRWSLHRIEAPDYMAGNLYRAMVTSNGKFSCSAAEFSAAIKPLIRENHEAGRRAKMKRPDASRLVHGIYDAMVAAGINLDLGPPLEAHGHRMSSGPND